MSKIEFDDVVKGEDICGVKTSDWVYLCTEHSKDEEIKKLGEITECPIDVVLCGVKGCDKEAMFYLDFNEEQK